MNIRSHAINFSKIKSQHNKEKETQLELIRLQLVTSQKNLSPRYSRAANISRKTFI